MSMHKDDPREIRKDMSGFRNWVGRIRGEEFGFFMNIIIPEKIFTKLSLLRTSESETRYHAQKIKKYLYGSSSGSSRSKRKKETLVELILAECTSIIEAHESIIDFMVGSMANKIPRGEEKGISIGDLSFVGYGENMLSITFARNNIMAIMRSVGGLDVDVKSYAKRLDEFLISKKSIKSKNAPMISTFTLSTHQMTVGGIVKISFNAIDPRRKDLMFKLFTRAGPISRLDNDDLILECKNLGNHKVELYAINKDLFVSNLNLDLIIV
jgi:hypothetical protein